MKNNDSINFDIREINFSGVKMMKMGFFFGLGLTVAKFASIIFGGKIALTTASKMANNGGKKALNSFVDTMKSTIENRIDELSDKEKEELLRIAKKVTKDEEKKEEK